MPLVLPSDFWVEIPAGRFAVGLLPDEARRLAIQSAEYKRFLGPQYSHFKSMSRHAELEEETGNPDWMTEYLLARYPAREVDLPAFAISRTPVMSDLFARFVADTGEPSPFQWGRDTAVAVGDVTFLVAVRLAEWAGARLPFEAEWERAARGPERRLFPWGDEFRPVGDWLEGFPLGAPLDPRTDTPEGIRGLVSNQREWCADYFASAPGFVPEKWGEESDPERARVLRGEFIGKSVQSAIARMSGAEARYATSDTSIRLVRADGKTIPPLRTPSRGERAALDVRAFDVNVLRPALRTMADSPLMASHHMVITSEVDDLNFDDRPRREVAARASDRFSSMMVGFDEDPDRASGQLRVGTLLIATSLDAARRSVPQHGVFVWTLQYRLSADGRVRARPTVTYRMAFDGEVHILEQEFRAGEMYTPIDEVTPELIQAHLLGAFSFYEQHSDDATSPL